MAQKLTTRLKPFIKIEIKLSKIIRDKTPNQDEPTGEINI